MFTGLIEEVGAITSVTPMGDSIRLEIQASLILEGIKIGDSISVDGCCLTVESFDESSFSLYASPETMKKTTLGDRQTGDAVNLERALLPTTRLGGHFVSGHVDATGTFEVAEEIDNSWRVRVNAPDTILRYCIDKGSVAIDGISLTIVDLDSTGFDLWIIPETWKNTTLQFRKPGDRVNLESDMIGKYTIKHLENQMNNSDLDERDQRLRNLLNEGWGQ